MTTKARVVEIQSNLVKFEVEARDSRQLIGSGSHTRAAIEVERFVRGLQKPKS